jgi:hypothetical protein
MKTEQAQAEYEKTTREELLGKVSGLATATNAIQAAATSEREFPGNPIDVLKGIASAVHAAEEVIDEHASGDRFSDETLKMVVRVLQAAHETMDATVFYGIMARRPQS